MCCCRSTGRYIQPELCQVQYLVPEVQGTSCTLYRLVGARYFRVPSTCSQVQGTFEYLVPTPWYKVLLRTLYLPPGTRSSTGSGTNRYRVKYIFHFFFYLITTRLVRLILKKEGISRNLHSLETHTVAGRIFFFVYMPRKSAFLNHFSNFH